jgi:hypothetical protein
MALGKRTKFYRITTAGEVETSNLVGEIIEIDGLSPTRDTQEDTTYACEDDGDARTYERGQLEPGELTLKIRFKKAENVQAKEMEDEFYAANIDDDEKHMGLYEMHYPIVNNPTRKFRAIITGVSEPLPANENMTQEFKFKLSGKPERGTWVEA